MTLDFSTLRYHAALPGAGGRLKVEVEDFEVEEIPETEASGQGEHLLLWIEKRGLDAEGLVRHLVDALGIDPDDVGAAGLKDARAVTRQHVTVPARCEARLPQLESPAVRLLSAARHDQKLRTGRLRGNRFTVLVRGADPAAAAPIVERLRSAGFPNFYGAQRFGRGGATVAAGLTLLRDATAPVGRGRMPRLALSAAQSALFNTYLRLRLQDGLFERVLRGDVVEDRRTSVNLWALDAAVLQAPYERGEVVPLGPMFGPKMRRAKGDAAPRERAVLAAAGLDDEAFARLERLAPGTRRPIRVWPGELAHTAEPSGLRLRFTLPPGAYATVLLAELMGEAAVGGDCVSNA